MNALLEEEDPDDFFAQVRSGEPSYAQRWTSYLTYLAWLIDSLHLVNDVDFILGGHLAPYFTQEDISFLYDEICRRTPFPESQDFIHISKMPSHNITVGAALPYIRAFLQDIGSGLDGE